MAGTVGGDTLAHGGGRTALALGLALSLPLVRATRYLNRQATLGIELTSPLEYGLAGVALLGGRAVLLTLVGLTISLFSITYYPAPWAATTAYPLVYAGAGMGCAALGGASVRLLRALPGARSSRRRPAPRGRLALAGRVVALVVALILGAPPNADLLGDTGFLLTWWGYFAARYLF